MNDFEPGTLKLEIFVDGEIEDTFMSKSLEQVLKVFDDFCKQFLYIDPNDQPDSITYHLLVYELGI